MTILPIIQPDNPLLRRPAQRVKDFDADFQRLIDDMVETMTAAQGVGLAGPQVARSLRIIVVRLPDDDESREEYGEDAGKLYAVANPTVVWRSEDKVSGVEGCLSLPGLLGDVERFAGIEVAGQDRGGKPIRLTACGWLGRVFQHEIDHLDGVLYIDIATDVWRPEEEADALAGEICEVQ